LHSAKGKIALLENAILHVEYLCGSVSVTLPLLYTFRRCPYAMRARLALQASGVAVEMVEVSLRAKPQALLDCSPKGTVPVLRLSDGTVIEESLDIMRWALALNDPEDWMGGGPAVAVESAELIARNDGPFKQSLDRYKYATRFPEHPAEHYRDEAGTVLHDLEARLAKQPYLTGASLRFADIAIFPFVRQFAQVDRDWFDTSDYDALRRWLDGHLNSPLFAAIMKKSGNTAHAS
jgi:glutathione S-transferase